MNAQTPVDPQHLRTCLLAHVLPLLAFMLLSELAGLLRVDNSASPWQLRAPEHWVYPLQCVVVGGLLWAFRAQYRLCPVRGWVLAAAFALVGITAWVAPGLAFERWHQPGVEPPPWWQWLGMVERTQGFDPGVFPAHSLAWWSTLVVRFFRMVIIVPLVEEVFWRSFLMRYVQAEGRPFAEVPFGRHSWPAFWITTLGVTFIHQPSDYLGAFVWGGLMYGLAVRTRSLGSCVWMHAVGNLLLGLYIMASGQKGYW